MARVRGVSCILCESDPCECGLKAKRAPRLVVPKAPTLPTVRRTKTVELPPPVINPLAGRVQQAADTDSATLEALKNLTTVFPEMVLVSGEDALGPASKEYLKLHSWKERIRRGRQKL